MGRVKLLGAALIVVVLILGVAYALLSARTTPTINEPGALEAAVQNVKAAEGATISLPGGSRVVIPASLLKSDQTVSVALLPSPPVQPASGLITALGPVLSISFAPQKSAISVAYAAGVEVPLNAPGGIDVTLDLSKAAGNYQGTVPLAQIPLPGTGKDAVSVGLTGGLDSSGKLARMTISAEAMDNFQVPQGNAKVIAGLANWNRDLPAAPPDRYGPRLWDPLLNKWVGLDPSRLDKTKRTCVLVHGVGSSVENAFQGSDCVRGIGTNNGCEQVIGFDYAWSQPVETSGKQLAAFLAQLQGFDDIMIEAHSLGGAVSLAALSNSETSSLKVSKLVTLGSPLMGTTAADRPEQLLTVLANYGALQTSSTLGLGTATLKALYDGSSLRDLTSDNPLLAKIRSGATRTHPNMEVVPVAGTGGSLLQEVATGLGVPRIPAAEKMLNGWLFGSQQQDMIINGPSALGIASGLNIKTPPLTFPATHTQLECDATVQREVGKAVYAAPRALAALTPAAIAFSAMLPSPSVAAQTLVLRNVGPPGSTLDYVITTSVPGDAKWLKLSGPIRPLASGDSEKYDVWVDATGLAAGNYSATIILSERAKEGKVYSASVSLTIGSPTAIPTTVPVATVAPTNTRAPVPATATSTPRPAEPTPTFTATRVAPTATAVPPSGPGEIAGRWQGNFSYAATGRCLAVNGQWRATLGVSGSTLNIQWWDTWDQEDLSVIAPLVGNTVSWTFGSGEESVQVGPLTFSGGKVQGKLVGPVCTAASGRPNGSMEGTRIGP